MFKRDQKYKLQSSRGRLVRGRNDRSDPARCSPGVRTGITVLAQTRDRLKTKLTQRGNVRLISVTAEVSHRNTAVQLGDGDENIPRYAGREVSFRERPSLHGGNHHAFCTRAHRQE